MSCRLEKLSLLSLSFMLISSYSISSALPLMLDYFKGYLPDQVELLISLPSFFVILTLLANGLLTRLFSERQIIVTGLLTMTVAGLVPFFVPYYLPILISRMFFGVGTGMINAKAISIISERFSGQERVRMLGLRGSAEVVGSAFLTLLVGQAIKIQWNAAFLIYGFALVILCAYLFFVPKVEIEKAELDEEGLTEKLSPVILRLALAMALICAWTITINSAISLRVPLLVTGLHLGTSSDASVILSGQQLIGIVSGLGFAPLLARFQGRLLGAGLAGLGLSLLGLAVSPTLLLIGLSAIGTGFFYSIILTAIFHGLSVEVPAGLLNSATALVLLGCNFGSALSPYVLKLLGMVSTSGLWIFSFLGLTCLLLGALLFFKK